MVNIPNSDPDLKEKSAIAKSSYDITIFQKYCLPFSTFIRSTSRGFGPQPKYLTAAFWDCCYKMAPCLLLYIYFSCKHKWTNY